MDERVDRDDRPDVSEVTSLDDGDMNHFFGSSGMVEAPEEEPIDDLVMLDEEGTDDLFGVGEKKKPKKYRVVPNKVYLPPTVRGIQQ